MQIKSPQQVLEAHINSFRLRDEVSLTSTGSILGQTLLRKLMPQAYTFSKITREQAVGIKRLLGTVGVSTPELLPSVTKRG